jgi:hypothetical protein
MASSAYSLLFDGVNEYVSFGNILNFERTDAFSTSFWLKTTDVGAPAVAIMGNLAPASTYTGWEIYIDASGYLVLQLISSLTTSNYLQVRNTDATWNDGTWRHWVVTYNGNSLPSGIAMYLDGSLESLSTNFSNLTGSIFNTNAFGIGGRLNVGDSFYQGNIDELAVYNDVLTPAEAAWLHNGGRARNPKGAGAPGNLVAYWPLGDFWDSDSEIIEHSFSGFEDQPIPGPIYDSGGSTYPGTPTNMEQVDVSTDTPGGAFCTRSLSFDGVNEFVSMGDVFRLDRDDTFSISLWFKHNGGTGYESLVTKYQGGAPGIGWFLMWSDGVPSFNFYNGVSNRIGVSCATGSVGIDTWAHLVVTYNASQNAAGFRFYVGNVLQSLDVNSDTLANSVVSSAAFMVGNRADDTSLYGWDGKITDVTVYDWMLSDTEIAAIYNSGQPTDNTLLHSVRHMASYWTLGRRVYNGNPWNMELGDVVADAPIDELVGGYELGQLEMDFNRHLAPLVSGTSWDLTGSGAGTGPTKYYKMRAQDDDPGIPGSPEYITWIATGEPDFIGAGFATGTPTPSGSMVSGSATVVAEWEE